MKNIDSTTFKVAVIVVLSVFLSSCEKEGDNIFNMFDDVTITFHDNSPYSITGYKEVKVGDSVYIDYTITSANTDMYTACLLETGTSRPLRRVSLNESQRRSFSEVIKLKADEKAGETTYRIYATDKAGVYLGDGYKEITIDVKPDFTYYTQRDLYLPDSVDKVNKCYLSLTTGETFSYSDGAANSSKIDFGFYRAMVPTDDPDTFELIESIYSLSTDPLPYTFYDIGSWTKRSTLFSEPIGSNGLNKFNDLQTGAAIEEAAKEESLTEKDLQIDGSDLIYFLTPEGKYGALYINTISTHYKDGRFATFSWKIQN